MINVAEKSDIEDGNFVIHTSTYKLLNFSLFLVKLFCPKFSNDVKARKMLESPISDGSSFTLLVKWRLTLPPSQILIK